MTAFWVRRNLTSRRRATVALVAAGLAGALVAQPPPASGGPVRDRDRLTGFTTEHSARERAAEAAYKKIPSASVARRLDAFLARKTGLLGTQGDWRRVQYVVKKLRSYGLRPHVEKVYPYMSVPRDIRLVMTSPTRHVAQNKEICRSFETDCKHVVVGYNALSPSGNIKGQLVYANYGRTEDYRVLKRKGISVKNKIVLARYGEVFRGVKTNLAAQHGAKGVVLYSDPADDGFTQGKVYPHGPWRAADGIQRGSIQELWEYGGDPLTPGWKATKNARRISPDKANLGEIPTTPISYGSARPMLKALNGPKAPKSWQGGLKFPYRIGAGPAAVHMKLDIDYKVKPIWNVTATIRGAVHPHQVVYVGGHRDSWTYGSDDNLSGAEVTMQIGRGLGRLLARGWRPDRTIRLATWDGEEYGLFGSTEHAEGQGQGRLDHVVAYVNMDGAAGEDFGATGVPSLDRLVYDTTKTVHWPDTSGSIYDDWSKKSHGTPVVERLGSGSDYTAFIDHFGVPSVDLGASTDSGDYHCSCDNYAMMRRFIDPGWRHHVAMAKEVGLVTMRLANSDAVLLRYEPYANEVHTYLRQFAKAQQRAFGRQVVDVSRDMSQAKRWASASVRIQTEQQRLLNSGRTGPRLQAINARLMTDERDLLTMSGLPGRPWFRHQIYAPGVNEGYGTQELPALHDALFLHHNRAQAKRYEKKLFRSLRAATRTLRRG